MRLEVILILIQAINQEIIAQVSPDFLCHIDKIEFTDNTPEIPDIKVYKKHLELSEIENRFAVLGELDKDKNRYYFTPVVPFSTGACYTILLNGDINYCRFDVPKDYDSLKVLSVYPSVDKVPSNLLKWYISFSKPINPTDIYEHISLVTQEGIEIDRALLPLRNALISEDGRLFTIWMEPGRQKRDLGPNRIMGSILEAGKQYSLQINGVKDRKGIEQSRNVIKMVLALNADRIRPDIVNWSFSEVSYSTKDTLIIDFDEPLDYGSAINAFFIKDQNNNEMSGKWKLAHEETSIHFIPDVNWSKGTYSIVINSHIEDLAGNNLNRLFDQPVNKKVASTKKIDEFKYHTLIVK